MTKDEAIAYGKRTGVRFYVKSNTGALMGGYKTREKAEDAIKRFSDDAKMNPFLKGVKVTYHIEDAE